MSVVTLMAIYFVVWWITLFTVLPLYVTPQKRVKKGNDAGAPSHPHLLKKFILNSVVAAMVTLLIVLLTRE